MAKRALDITVSLVLLICTFPVLLLAMGGIAISSPGRVLFWGERMGKGGRPFAMAKLRTMHVLPERGPEITAPSDARVFTFGRLLRLMKIDELPQLWNVLKGDMSLVGPRPEAIAIVERYYQAWMMDTLQVRPGITSPGAIFGYTHGETLLDPADPEGSYARQVLPAKLAIERAYLEQANFVNDIGVMLRTAAIIVQIALGRRDFALPPEATKASRWHNLPRG